MQHFDRAPALPRAVGSTAYVADVSTREADGRPRYGVSRAEVLRSDPFETLLALDDGRFVSVATADLHSGRDAAVRFVERTLHEERDSHEAAAFFSRRGADDALRARDGEEDFLRRNALLPPAREEGRASEFPDRVRPD